MHILENAKKLKGTRIGISEDFSKYTLDIQRQLVASAKIAENKCGFIKGYKIKYKRLVIKYENPESKTIFFKGFNVSDVNTDPNWYLPKQPAKRKPNTS